MSHHLDTPLAAQAGQLFIDDLYVFQGNDSTVFVMDVNSTITGAHAEPGFHPEARYEFKVHLAAADFRRPHLPGVASATPTQTGDRPCSCTPSPAATRAKTPPTGDLVLEGRTGEAATGAGTRLWTGRIGDSFYIDLALLGMVNSAVRNGTALDLSGLAPGERARTASPAPPSNPSCWRSPTSTPSCGPGPHRRVGRHQARHRRRRLAADQPRRASHDVADLLARRHPVHQPGQHPAPVRGLRRRRQVHRRSHRRRRRGQRYLRPTPTATARPWPGNCFPTSCPTGSERRQATASPPATAAP